MPRPQLYPSQALDARPQKAVLQDINHSLVVAQLTMVCEVIAAGEIASLRGVPLSSTPAHKKRYTKKSTTRLVWRQLTMVPEVIAKGEIASPAVVP